MIAPVTCNCALHLVVIEGAFIVVDAAASQTQEVKLMDSIEPFPPLFIPGFRNRVVAVVYSYPLRDCHQRLINVI
jgi:hypothetical protein